MSGVRTRRGVALMLVLWLVVVLAALATGIVAETRATTSVVANLRARTTARAAAESGVAAALDELEDSLATLAADTSRRAAFLNDLDRALGAHEQGALGDAGTGAVRYAVALVDVSSRIDVNEAGAESLGALFASFVGAAEAERAAEAVQLWIGAEGASGADEGARAARARQLGIERPVGPLRTLDDLVRVPGVSERLARAAAPHLTVDGDGRINEATASAVVMSAARGSLVQEPSRILIVSRGWTDGHPLTHEIQAVFPVSGARLLPVRRRERDL